LARDARRRFVRVIRTAVVVGAGIGGLAAGIALRQAGCDVTVYERADELRPLGAGLSIWPNGVRALRSLGLGHVADEAPRTGGALRRADGSPLADFDPDTIATRYDAPLVGINRADLHGALVRELGEPRLHLGARVTEVGQDRLGFADGDEARAELIVGADGLNSLVRDAVLRDGDPVDSGIVAFRGLAEWESDVPAGEWWGPGSVAGLLPLSDGLVYWYVAMRGRADGAELRNALHDYSPPLPQIAHRTARDRILCHHLFDRPPAKRWSNGTMTLLGDAAHPMLPFLGQGACSALEDAVALGEAVAGSEHVRAALSAYEARRLDRTAALVRRSRQAASLVLPGAGLRRRVRDLVVARLPDSVRLRQLDRVIRPS
jgi:2-polyprenyl-6-methoxyphenol hydroxylase-like FAD-dependent oxidoreductase